jgi:hypothetical protein
MSSVVRQLRRFSSLAISGCFALALTTVAHAQTFAITNLTSNSASKASYPNMVVDNNHNLNLIWIDSVKGIMFARSSTTAGVTTVGPVDGSKGQALPAFQPQIAVSPNNANVIAITWAALDPSSTPTAPMYDVYASWSSNGLSFLTTKISAASSPAGLPLADSPRLAFDTGGRVNIVWGRNAVWIRQTQDGSFPNANAAVNLATQATNTGGPRVAVDASGEVVVVWTDMANASAPGTYCVKPPNPAPDNASIGGYFWVNETLPPAQAGALYTFGTSTTRNLSNTDWVPVAGTEDAKRFANGFFGCSFDNLNLFTDKAGHVNLLWSDELPIEDVLTSKPINGDALTHFSFPINLASLPAAWPKVAVDGNGSFYVVWSGGPTGGTDSQGIFFSRSDDGGNNFTTAVNIAPANAVAPAYPQVAVDSTGNVYVAWEQVDQSQPISNSDTFKVFFARSKDKGATFPTVEPVSTNSFALCIPATPVQTTPDSTTCGTVQIGVDANFNPDMAWVNGASGAAVADIDLATSVGNNVPGSVAPTSASISAATPSANFTVNVNPTVFTGSVTFSCSNAGTGAPLPSWLSCTFNPAQLNPAQTTQTTLTLKETGTPTASFLISPPASYGVPGFGSGLAMASAWTMTLAALCVMLMMFTLGRRHRFSAALVLRGLLVMTLAIVLAAGLVSCGGSTSSTPSTGTTGTGDSGGSGGGGGNGGGTSNPVQIQVAVMAKSSTNPAPVSLGTVTITAQ